LNIKGKNRSPGGEDTKAAPRTYACLLKMLKADYPLPLHAYLPSFSVAFQAVISLTHALETEWARRDQEKDRRLTGAILR